MLVLVTRILPLIDCGPQGEPEVPPLLLLLLLLVKVLQLELKALLLRQLVPATLVVLVVYSNRFLTHPLYSSPVEQCLLHPVCVCAMELADG